MRALVTGANGLIGSNVVRELVENRYQVRAFVRNTSDLRSLEKHTLQYAFGDILDVSSLERAMQGCDCVFHVASVYAYWGHTSQELETTAKQGALNVLASARRAGVKRIILTSSSAIFGSSLTPVPLDESCPLDDGQGISPYVHAKVEQERAAQQAAQDLGLELISVCPTITVGGPDYGLTESNRMLVSYLLDPFKATWIGGCNIVSVRDVAKGHLLAAEKGRPGERYILASENLEWPKVHEIVSELCGLPGPLVTANHTMAYLAASLYEMRSLITRSAPASTRVQAKMVGKYYWYAHDRMKSLGYSPKTSRQALAEAISWLVASHHVPSSLRATMSLSKDVHMQRRRKL
jgi:dihydroflavonol-4-reductase